MIAGDVVSSVAYAVVSAITNDLLPLMVPEIRFELDPGVPGTRRVETGETIARRPTEGQCEVYVFPQVWSSTALGFGGLGGQAITTAYTTVVIGPAGDACVYFGKRLAYHIAQPDRQVLAKDIAQARMVSVAESGRYKQQLGDDDED